MKVNKEISDLARKLDFIGIDGLDRRKMIKKCFNPFTIRSLCLIDEINNSYTNLKKKVEEYNELCEENKKLNNQYREIMENIYPLLN